MSSKDGCDAPSLRESPRSAVLHCSRGKVEARVGDEFDAAYWTNDRSERWRIEGFTGDRIYSPSGFGGAPIVRCRPLDGMPPTWKQYDNGDGTVDWCGDSVGAALLGQRKDGASPQTMEAP